MDAIRPRGSWPVGDLLVEWCEEHGVTQYWLAQEAAVGDRHLSRIITGRALFSADVAVRLARATGIDAKLLFRLQNDRLIEIAQGK